jgi:3-oxoacyl-[acyl-carrier-protein] synthase II
MNRVVITGIGALTPIGNTVEDFKNGLMQGASGAVPITHFDATNFKTKFACEVTGLDLSEHLDRKEIRRLDLYAHYAMVTAEEALADSGLEVEKIDPFRAGVIWGSGIGGLHSLEQEIADFATGNGIPRYNPFMIPKMITNIAAGHISIKYGLKGINYATVSACATSNHAIINAFDYLRIGKADVILSGGSEAAILKAGVGGFNSMKALSERNDDPKTASRPYDRDRDGFVLGEGSGALLLETLDHARARGAKIYAEIIGTGCTADAYHITAPQPEGLAVKKAMQIALEEAQVTPDEIDYVNTHGTSTLLGDVAELNALREVFGDAIYKCNVSSTKSMTGHLLGAAGAIEAIACILAMQDGFVPPTINHFTDDPEIDNKVNLTFNEAQSRSISLTLNNAFGFGGHNTVLIFRKF